MTPSDYPPRSLLYVPGSNARALDKAAGLAADMLIIDLEDAVPADRKVEARDAMRAAVTAGFPGKRVAVRVNATGTAEQADDIAAIAGLTLVAFAMIGANQNFPFGGTSILIMVGVALDTVKQIESQLQQRNYEGFLK